MGKKVQEEQSEEKKGEKQQQVEHQDLNRSVFVSGLPYSVDSDQIKEFFAKCGTIESMKLPRYQDTNKIIGYCHIIFSTIEEAQKAIKLNKSMMGDRYLDISISKGEKKVEYKNDMKPPEDCKTIFVKNIPFDSKEDEIGELFEKCGKVENVRFVYHPHQRHFKGFAFIDFKMNSSVNAAIKMNGMEFKDRKLMIDFEVGGMKKGFRFQKSDEGNMKYNQQYEDIAEGKRNTEKKIHKFDKLQNFSQRRDNDRYKGNDKYGGKERYGGNDRQNGYDRNKGNDREGGYNRQNSYKRNDGQDRQRGGYDKDRGSFPRKPQRENLKLFSKKD